MPQIDFAFDSEMGNHERVLTPPLTSARILAGDALHELDAIDSSSCKLLITSPPYNIGKEYEKDQRLSLNDYLAWIDPIIEKACDKISSDGHVCWQTGNFVERGELYPLDIKFYDAFKKRGLKLRNRIIWHFNFGLHAQTRFSGRYETLLWFTKSDDYTFNLDPVRVRQLYPGKRHSSRKGAKAGQPSGNPKGKNPTDFWTFDALHAFQVCPIWDFPNVKANHPEKTTHPCQFPSELVERCVLALTNEGDTVLDPFVGSGTSAIAALNHGRHAIGIDKDSRYAQLAEHRIDLLLKDQLPIRKPGVPPLTPRSCEKVASIPKEWHDQLTGDHAYGDEAKKSKEA